MKSIEELEQVEHSLDSLLSLANSQSFLDKTAHKKIELLTLGIKKKLSLDYEVPLKFKQNEKEKLERIFVNYLTGKADDFNSHYIQLLAWNLVDLKIMRPKKGSDDRVSIFEYSPNPLNPFSVIEKTFRLFRTKRIKFEKVAYPLLYNYLNNYKIVSKRYKSELNRFLSKGKFFNELNLCFATNIYNDVVLYLDTKYHSGDGFPEDIKQVQLPNVFLKTKFFSDCWFLWMMNKADLTNKQSVLKKLNCDYYRMLDLDMQKILLAKIIYDNQQIPDIYQYVHTEDVCCNYIFPCILSGNPFSKDFWDLDYGDPYKKLLDFAWQYIDVTFVRNEKYKYMVKAAKKNGAKT